MPNAFDSATQQALAARLRFYRDLGLTELYRRPVDPALLARLKAAAQEPAETQPAAAAEPVASAPAFTSEEAAIPPRKPFPAQPPVGGIVPAAEREAALRVIQEDIGECTRCELHKGRNKIVFADGSPTARLMFVGEGPGADEDAQGLPFVGRAGQLLNNMIGAMGLKREDVYIANVVKCRPPGNRTPEPEEAHTCSPFLFRQIDVVRPEVLVALGATAATYLLGQRQPLAGLRGRIHSLRGARLIVTYHPAYLLRDPRQKKEAWADLQIAMKELGLTPPAKG
ncbi:MAG: uracil-DNA glycosylase [Terracidiphilus sp.]|nr:uracil-DNA glycosylase [Terracidiphilus sp.]